MVLVRRKVRGVSSGSSAQGLIYGTGQDSPTLVSSRGWCDFSALRLP